MLFRSLANVLSLALRRFTESLLAPKTWLKTLITTPMRVFVSISTKSSHWSKAWDRGEEVIKMALVRLQEHSADVTVDTPTLYLARQRWPPRICIAFDLFRDSYDPATAHLAEENNLPVTMVSLAQKDVVVSASSFIQDQVNREVRSAHDAHGVGSRPPFTIDHANGNVQMCPNPRTRQPWP